MSTALPPQLAGASIPRRELVQWLRELEVRTMASLVACPEDTRMRQLQGQAQFIAELIKKLDV